MYKLSNYSAVLQIRTDAAMEGLVVFYVLPWTMIELKTSSHRISLLFITQNQLLSKEGTLTAVKMSAYQS